MLMGLTRTASTNFYGAFDEAFDLIRHVHRHDGRVEEQAATW